MTPLVIAAIVLALLGGIAIVAGIVLVLWRKAGLLEMQASVTRVEFLRLSRSYGVGTPPQRVDPR